LIELIDPTTAGYQMDRVKAGNASHFTVKAVIKIKH